MASVLFGRIIREQQINKFTLLLHVRAKDADSMNKIKLLLNFIFVLYLTKFHSNISSSCITSIFCILNIDGYFIFYNNCLFLQKYAMIIIKILERREL